MCAPRDDGGLTDTACVVASPVYVKVCSTHCEVVAAAGVIELVTFSEPQVPSYLMYADPLVQLELEFNTPTALTEASEKTTCPVLADMPPGFV